LLLHKKNKIVLNHKKANHLATLTVGSSLEGASGKTVTEETKLVIILHFSVNIKDGNKLLQVTFEPRHTK